MVFEYYKKEKDRVCSEYFESTGISPNLGTELKGRNPHQQKSLSTKSKKAKPTA